jgi:hypothetical protein
MSTISKPMPLWSYVARLASLMAAIGVSPASLKAQDGQSAEPGAPKVLYACYVPASGTVYRVKEADTKQECACQQHAMFSWTDGYGAVRGGDGWEVRVANAPPLTTQVSAVVICASVE